MGIAHGECRSRRLTIGLSPLPCGKFIVFAVVVTVTVAFAALVPLSASDAGLIVHVAPAGAPAQVSASVPLAPVGVNARLYVAVCPAVMDWLVEEPLAAPAVKSCPVPVRVTVCVLLLLPLLSSVTAIAAVRAPPAEGVNVTLIVHVPLAATLAPQVFV